MIYLTLNYHLHLKFEKDGNELAKSGRGYMDDLNYQGLTGAENMEGLRMCEYEGGRWGCGRGGGWGWGLFKI